MPLHLKAGGGDLLLITEPALLMRCAWQSHAINCTVLLWSISPNTKQHYCLTDCPFEKVPHLNLWMGHCVPNMYMPSNMKKTTQTTLFKDTFLKSKSPNVWLHWRHYSGTKTLCRPRDWSHAKSIQKPLTKKGVTVRTQETHHHSEGLDLQKCCQNTHTRSSVTHAWVTSTLKDLLRFHHLIDNLSSGIESYVHVLLSQKAHYTTVGGRNSFV